MNVKNSDGWLTYPRQRPTKTNLKPADTHLNVPTATSDIYRRFPSSRRTMSESSSLSAFLSISRRYAASLSSGA